MLNLIILILFNSNPLVGVHDIGVTTPTYPAMLGNPFLTSSKSGEFLLDTNVKYVPDIYPYHSSVAFDGTNYLLVWEDSRQGYYADIYGVRISPNGEILDPAGIVISDSKYYEQCNPAVAFNGTDYLVVWQLDENIYATRVSVTGQVLDIPGIDISKRSSQWFPQVISDGTNWLVVWEDGRDYPHWNIYGTRVSPTAQTLDTADIPICTATGIYDKEHPVAAFNGTNYLVAWGDVRNTTSLYDIYGTLVTPAGTVLNPSGIPISDEINSQRYPAVASDGVNYLVGWEDGRGGVYGTRVSPTGQVLDTAGFIITNPSQIQRSPVIAFDGTNYLVVGENSRYGPYDIYGARISVTGSVLDTAGFPISTAAHQQTYPVMAFDGTNYLVAWQDEDRDFYSTRVDKNGNVLDTSGISVTKAYGQDAAAIAFDGTNYFVVWSDRRNGLSDIYGARVTSAGNVLDPACIPISTAINTQSSPAVVFDGTNYFVVWNDDRNGLYSGNIYGARVTQTGQVLDTSGIGLTTGLSYAGRPKVAFDGTNYFVVWEAYNDIYGKRINKLGEVLDTAKIPISTTYYSHYPDVEFDGTNYLVVWQDEDRNNNIYGTRVTQTGQIMDTASIIISTECDNACPAIAFDGTNYFVVWETRSPMNTYAARVNPAGQLLDSTGIPFPTGSSCVAAPAVVFDGTNYIVTWYESRILYNCDIYGAILNPAGITIDTFIVSIFQPFFGFIPVALAHGNGSEIFIAYPGWTDSINTHPANTMRIWGKIYPYIGVEENSNPQSLTPNPRLSISPNPAHSSIVIQFSVVNSRDCSLKLFDISGRCVKILVNETQPAGRYNITLNAKDLSTGIYFAVLSTENFKTSKKLILMK